MSNISLLGSLSVCKVDTGYANKLQSDRFENPNNLLCPLWTGSDTYGRTINSDTFVTKNAGCNSAGDRVGVENFLRPQYMEYVSLDAMGFRDPNIFNTKPPSELSYKQNIHTEHFAPVSNHPIFGINYNYNNVKHYFKDGQKIIMPYTGYYQESDNQSLKNFEHRQNLSSVIGFEARKTAYASGSLVV